MTSLDEVRARQSVALKPFSSFVRRVADWRHRRRGLAQLQELDDHLLRDVGLSKWDVREMRRHW